MIEFVAVGDVPESGRDRIHVQVWRDDPSLLRPSRWSFERDGFGEESHNYFVMLVAVVFVLHLLWPLNRCWFGCVQPFLREIWRDRWLAISSFRDFQPILPPHLSLHLKGEKQIRDKSTTYYSSTMSI